MQRETGERQIGRGEGVKRKILPGTNEEIVGGVRRIRDEICAWIDETFGVG